MKHLSMLKRFAAGNIMVKTDTFLMNLNVQKNSIYLKLKYCNIINAFTVIFKQF